MDFVVNTIGFTEEKKLLTAERLIGYGALTASIGTLAVGIGLIIIKRTQRWYQPAKNEQMGIIGKTYQFFNEHVTE